MARNTNIIEIGDVEEAFCGVWRRTMVSLKDKEPDIASEWLYKKNCGWGPEDFSHGSGVKPWWKCPDCKRGYQTQICRRTGHSRSKCPYCANRRVCPDNALTALFPKIAREWHPTKNKKLKANDLVAGSKTQVWWLCKAGHVWKQRVSVRTRLGLDCPQCYRDGLREASDYSERDEKGRIVLGKKSKKGSRIFYERWKKSYVPLSRSHPKIAKEWHPTKNGPFKPADFAPGADVVAWWKCNKDASHEWQSVIGWRTHRRGIGCPFCSNYRANNKNSLQAQFPDLAKEWHPTKNRQQKPGDIVSGSGKKVWWQCQTDKKHCWSAPVYRRTKLRSGCPYCSHFKVSDLNSLKKLHPLIAAQFHPTKNGSKRVSEIAVASTNLIWWLCSEGPDHEWRATPSSRTIAGQNCPMCSGRQVSVTNSLATLYPHLAAQWDYRKNGDVTPHDVTAGTPRNFWWLCDAGHNWLAAPNSRKKTRGDCYECKTGRPRPPGPKRIDVSL